ncbi:MAG TPA: glycosyltransferase family 39 protein [Longimicrobiaceae bacterium]|nr:glycosyltransferase family 39 protein [Longimicrobiaceae bacterium]
MSRIHTGLAGMPVFGERGQATPRGPLPARPPLAAGVLAALAALKLALHLAVNALTPYGVHRDELLYMAMGERLRLWRMDFPPLIALVSELQRGLFGDSLVAIRLVPALAGAALAVLAGVIARELGGGRFAQGLAALAVLAGPLFLRPAALFQPVVLDQLWWTLGLLALVRLSRTGSPRAWIALGAACGLGLLTKFSILFFGLGVFLALLATPHRRALRTRWPWVALATALLLGAPSIVGQVRLGFPVVGQMGDLRETQLARVGAAEFVLGQAAAGPAVLLALVGLAALLGTRAMRPFRVVGWSCLFAFGVLLLLRGKPYYAGPVYPALFAAGAVQLELLSGRVAGPAVRWGTAAVLAAFGAVALPLGVPVLAPERMAAYVERLGASEANRNNRGGMERLPQDYADMLGWPEQAAAVARVYHALPPEKRARAAVFAGNYGEAGAIDFHGRRLGLPRAVSAAGSYWFFGPGDRPGDVLVSIGVPAEALRRYFPTVTEAGRVANPWGVEEERDVPVHVAEGAPRSLREVWPELAGRN